MHVLKVKYKYKVPFTTAGGEGHINPALLLINKLIKHGERIISYLFVRE